MILTKDKAFYKTVFALAVPMVLQNLITYSVGLADNIMIGKLGDSAVSGVYLGYQLATVLQMLSTGVEMTLLLFSAQYWGKSDTAGVKKVLAVGARFSLLIGAIFGAVCGFFPKAVISLFTNEEAVIEAGTGYLSFLAFSFFFFTLTQLLIASMRSVENARIGLIVSSVSLGVDVLLNYLLIFGKLGLPALGVRGAALATLISRIVEWFIIVIYVFKIDKKLHLRPSELLRVDKAILHDFVHSGVSIMAGQIVWSCNLMANGWILGHFEEAVITAAGLANTINSLMYVSMNGLAGAVGIVVGKTIGSDNLEKIKEYARTAQLLFLSLGLLTSVLFFCIRNPFLSLYQISDEARAEAGRFINVLCVTCIGTCYQCGSLMGLVKSGGDVKFVFHNDTFFVFCVVLPSAFITSRLGLAPWIVFLCLKSDQILKCIPAFFKIRRYDWMKKLTRSEE